jgi:hypothetical protein
MNVLRKCVGVFFIPVILITSRICAAPLPLPLLPITPASDTLYATFGSYQQRVVSNRYGIFFTYKISDQSGEWHLKRSVDDGKTFTTVYKAINNDKAPPLETDSNGNLYMISYRSQSDTAFIKFSSSNEFKAPIITKTVADSSTYFSAKKALFLDEPRQQMYAFTHMSGMFYIFDLNGNVKKKYQLITSLPYANGGTGYIEYPLLYVDEQGVVYAAWTNQMHKDLQTRKYGNISNRRTSIHFMLSKDGGTTWQKPDGTKLTVPVISDEHGPATMISRSDEIPGPWLCSFLVKNMKIHFLYNYFAYKEDGTSDGTRSRMHYVRYDLKTQQKYDHVYAENPKGVIPGVPSWGGETISIMGISGFLTARKEQKEIYMVGNSSYRIGILVTLDEGNSWNDVAQSEKQIGYGRYSPRSITGARALAGDGKIIGIFTHQVDSATHSVLFFNFNPSFSPSN